MVVKKYIFLLPAQACEDTTAPVKTTDPAPNSAPVEVLVEPNEDSCSRNDSKALQETESTHVALCLVHYLKSSSHPVYFSFMWSCLTIVSRVWEFEKKISTKLTL